MELKLETRDLDTLIPYENNPRIIEKAIPQVAESIRQVGYINPIVVDEDGVILAGHTRLEALKADGFTLVDVVVVSGLTEEQRKKYRVLDNKTGEVARWNKRLLAEEIGGLDFGGFDFGQDISGADFEGLDPVDGTPGEKKRVVYCPRIMISAAKRFNMWSG